jgi:GT2 family glycosyltransferase
VAIIPSWDGKELLEVVLPSLERQTFRDFAVVVVDNGSTDGSLEYLEREWPDVTVIGLPENQGFASAVNRGLDATKSELVALLNNDLELDPQWLKILVRELDAHPDAGSSGGKLLKYFERHLIDGAGEIVSWYGTFGKRGEGERDVGQYDRGEYLFGVNAGASLYRRSVFDTVGQFDEDYFAYVEDIDLHLRAQLVGFKAWYAPEAVAYHMVNSTAKRDPSHFFRYLVNRNRLLFLIKNLPLSRLLRHSPKLAFYNLRVLGSSLRGRWTPLLLKAWWDVLIHLRATLGKRRLVLRSRTVPLTYIDSIISPRLPAHIRLLRLRARP